MSISKPFRRTCRQFADGEYSEGGRWRYLIHPRFAEEPRHYVRAFLSIQSDLLTLFDFVEPADANLGTYSQKIQQLLLRTCVEVEANLTAILKENGYQAPSGNLTMRHYRLVNYSHRLSSFRIRIPAWRGACNVRQPFKAWASPSDPLQWYQEYNKAKHDRHEFFHRATFGALIDAVCGLAVILSGQFLTEDYSPNAKSLGISGDYSYDSHDDMETAIGDFFRVAMPTDWPEEDRYEFVWPQLEHLEDPFATYDFSQHPLQA
jgi:hypothetical protein